MKLMWTIGTVAVQISLVLTGYGQVVLESDPDLERIDVIEHLGDRVPPELTFVNDLGDTVQIGDYFGQGRTSVLVLGYYRCPMLCNLVFNGLVDGFNELDWELGRDYQVINVSIDPTETFDLGHAKRANYLKELTIPVVDHGWTFMVGAQDQSEALAEAVGFKYFYDTVRQEYAHPAVAMILTEDGTISRYLYGVHFTKTDLKLSLMEASEGKIGNTIDKLILYCFHYDPDSKGYTVVATNVMKLGGGATLIVLAIFLSLLFYGEKLRKRSRATATSTPEEKSAGQ